MYSATVLLFLVAPLCLAAKVPGCNEVDNAGVLNKFGPLPSNLRDSNYYNKEFLEGQSLTNFQLQGSLEKYVLEYKEYTELGASSSGNYGYHKVFYDDNGVYKLLDYVRVNPYKWKQFEDAIIDADHLPLNSTVRVKFLLSDCRCVIREYDLRSADIPGTAITKDCSTFSRFYNPYKLKRANTGLAIESKYLILGPNEKYPYCKVNQNYGVFYEFGHLHPNLFNPDYFTKVASTPTSTFRLSAPLQEFRAEYTEFREKPSVGSGEYGYITLRYTWQGQEKILDYVRVNTDKWKQFQEGILEGDKTIGLDLKIRMKYLTEDCTCVMRVYDLKHSQSYNIDIVGNAKTMACNGAPLPTPLHKLAGPMHQNVLIAPTLKPLPGSEPAKFLECDANNNVGVLGEFGPLPRDLLLGSSNYRRNVYSNILPRYHLDGSLNKYTVEYFEFDQAYGMGTKMLSYLALYFTHDDQEYLLDYVRVNYLKWNQIENAIIGAEVMPMNGMIKVKYLKEDCTCVTREYNLKVPMTEFYFRGKSVNCVDVDKLPPTKTTSLTELLKP